MKFDFFIKPKRMNSNLDLNIFIKRAKYAPLCYLGAIKCYLSINILFDIRPSSTCHWFYLHTNYYLYTYLPTYLHTNQPAYLPVHLTRHLYLDVCKHTSTNIRALVLWCSFTWHKFVIFAQVQYFLK